MQLFEVQQKHRIARDEITVESLYGVINTNVYIRMCGDLINVAALALCIDPVNQNTDFNATTGGENGFVEQQRRAIARMNRMVLDI